MTDNKKATPISRCHFLARTALTTGAVAGAGTLLGAGAGPTSRAEAAAPRAKVTVRVAGEPPESAKVDLASFQAQVAAFERQHPDITIAPSSYYFDPGTFYTRFAAGQAEDVVGVYFTDTQFIFDHGYAADVDKLVRSWHYFSSFDPRVLSAATGPHGHLYGVPLGANTLGLLYNRALFRKVGLDPDKPPTTWDQFRAYAKRLTNGKGHYGFADVSTQNQGGWHFTMWLYSAGGRAEQSQGGKVTASFNGPAGVKVLEMLQAMRFADGSMPKRQLLTVSDTNQMLATGQIAMAIGNPGYIGGLKQTYGINLEDFGCGPLPQGGGNATLVQGESAIFNPKSSPAVIDGAFAWVLYYDLSLDAYEASLKATRAAGGATGLPGGILFRGEYQKRRQAIAAKYTNVPLKNYAPYVNATLRLVPEPPVQSQKMYAALDPVIQAVLTQPGAKPKQLLDQAARQFQSQILDNARQ